MLNPPTTLPPGSIIDSYRRDSGGARQDKSTDQQLTEIEAFCKQHGLIHRNRFVDAARSGGSTVGRDDFNRMMDQLEIPANRPHGLLLWNYARFARDIDDAQFNKIRLRQWGIIIHSLNDSVPEGEYGRVIEFLIDVANEEKRKQTSIDAKRGIKDLVEKYGCMPGTPPPGFKRTPVNLGLRRDKTEHIAHRWDPDPEVIPRVRQAFQMKAAGATHEQITKATHLYNSKNSYKAFFQNKLYIGILIFGELAIEHYCDPVIDLATWHTVQKILALHSNRQHVSASSRIHPRRRSETATYLLSGIVFCGRCKSPLYGHSSKQRNGTYYLRYACTRRNRRNDCDLQHIPARPLEKEVLNQLTHWFEDPANLQALYHEEQLHQAGLAAKNKLINKDTQKKLTLIRRSISNITNAIAERGHSAAMLAKLNELEIQEAQYRSEMQLVLTQTPNAQPSLTYEEIAFLCKRISTRLHTKDNTIIRTLMHGFINQIIIDRDGKNAFGIITIHTPREPETAAEDNPARNTVSKSLHPVGAPLHTHSIQFTFTIDSAGIKKTTS